MITATQPEVTAKALELDVETRKVVRELVHDFGLALIDCIEEKAISEKEIELVLEAVYVGLRFTYETKAKLKGVVQ